MSDNTLQAIAALIEAGEYYADGEKGKAIVSRPPCLCGSCNDTTEVYVVSESDGARYGWIKNIDYYTGDFIAQAANARPAIKSLYESAQEMAEALEQAKYALDRAACFKHPSSSQKEIELKSIKVIDEALSNFNAMKDIK